MGLCLTWIDCQLEVCNGKYIWCSFEEYFHLDCVKTHIVFRLWIYDQGVGAFIIGDELAVVLLINDFEASLAAESNTILITKGQTLRICDHRKSNRFRASP